MKQYGLYDKSTCNTLKIDRSVSPPAGCVDNMDNMEGSTAVCDKVKGRSGSPIV